MKGFNKALGFQFRVVFGLLFYALPCAPEIVLERAENTSAACWRGLQVKEKGECARACLNSRISLRDKGKSSGAQWVW